MKELLAVEPPSTLTASSEDLPPPYCPYQDSPSDTTGPESNTDTGYQPSLSDTTNQESRMDYGVPASNPAANSLYTAPSPTIPSYATYAKHELWA